MRWALIAAAFLVSGCTGWNPWGAAPGETVFEMGPDRSMKFRTNGVDRKHAAGSVKLPDGTEIKFRIEDSNSAASTNNSLNQSSAVLLGLIAAGKSVPPDLLRVLLPAPTLP